MSDRKALTLPAYLDDLRTQSCALFRDFYVKHDKAPVLDDQFPAMVTILVDLVRAGVEMNLLDADLQGVIFIPESRDEIHWQAVRYAIAGVNDLLREYGADFRVKAEDLR